MRPDEICLRTDSVPLSRADAGLQSLVHRVCARFFLVQVEEVGIVARSAITVDAVARQICCCDLLLRRLVDVEKLEQLGAFRSYVSDLQHQAARELMLDIEVKVLD